MPFSSDPYPDIPPALLNSADLWAYAVHPSVQLISTFDPKNLKSASYELPFEGTVYHWEPEGILARLTKKEVELTNDVQFNIRPNSIVYVCPKPKFCIPNYLALRFNLTITRVHQGLLLGTGPLVDPGFEGRLLIPLHNLTNQDIVIQPDEGFIWIEVTKLSPFPPPNAAHSFPYQSFPERKRNRTALQYFRKATQGKAITSSVQATLDEVKVFQSRTKYLLGSGAVGGIFALVALLLAAFQLYSLVQTANGRYDTVTAETQNVQKRIENQMSLVDGYAKQLETQSKQLAQQAEEIGSLRTTVEQLRRTQSLTK